MKKDEQVAFRLPSGEKQQMLDAAKKLNFKNLSHFIFFLWLQFKSERNKQQ